ncbi:hypothetical protein ACFL3S_10600 [Gemmatimonadota bacterium]
MESVKESAIRFASGTPKKRISSGSTAFWKWVFTPAWIVLVGGFTAAGWLGLLDRPPSGGPLLLLSLIWAGLGAFFLWWACKLEHVWLEGDELVVRRCGLERRVPLTQVREISETHWSRVKTVTIDLRPGSRVGEKILFIPPVNTFPFLDHPLVKDLQRRKRLVGTRYTELPELP